MPRAGLRVGVIGLTLAIMAGLPSLAAESAAPIVNPGDTIDEVVAKLGPPRGSIERKNTITYSYDRGMVNFIDGRVASSTLVPPEEAERRRTEQERAAEASRQQAERQRQRLLAESQADFGLRPSIGSAPGGKGAILIGRCGRDKVVDEALARLKLELPAELPGPYGQKILAQAYVLAVEPEGVVLAARSGAGIFHGAQTLKQLLRANSIEKSIPCCRIVDYPALAYRCWQNDISRGPIPTLAFLKRQVRTLSEFKLNAMTMYTENVFQNPKHPKIAPPDALCHRPG